MHVPPSPLKKKFQPSRWSTLMNHRYCHSTLLLTGFPGEHPNQQNIDHTRIGLS